MNKIIAIVIVAAIGIGVWKFWPDIMGKVQEAQNDDEKTDEKSGDPAPPAGTDPNQPVAPPLGQNPAPPIGINPIPPSNPGGGNPQPPVTPGGAQPPATLDVTLTMEVLPHQDGKNLRDVVTMPESIRMASFQYRGAGGPTWIPTTPRPAESQFTFTGPRDVRSDVTFEFLLDPTLQPPDVLQFIGDHGQLMTGPFVREVDQRFVIHAAIKVRPAGFRFTPRNPQVKVPVIAAPKNSKV